jgi:hypothetical protein
LGRKITMLRPGLIAGMLVLLLVVPGFVVAPAQDQPDPEKKQDPKPPPSQRGDNPDVFQPLTEEQEKILREQKARYSLEPVKSEPELPSIDKVAETDRLPGGGYLVRNKKGRIVRAVVPGRVGINSGLIEVFATLGPKDHESVLKIVCDIHVLDLTLSSLIGLKRGTLPEKYGEADRSDPSRILVFISWRNEEGKLVTHRAEDLLIDVKRRQTFPRVGWLYQGAWEVTEHPVTRRRQKMLRAALSKLGITTFRDPYSLIDNVLKDEDATDDIYAANMFVLPPPGTEILCSMRKPTAEELETIKKVEKEFYK